MKNERAAPTTSEPTALSPTDHNVAVVPLENSHGSSGMQAPMANITKDDRAASNGFPVAPGVKPSSSRAWVSRASSGSRIILTDSSSAMSGSTPRLRYNAASSRRSSSGSDWIARRSTSSSRSINSDWARIETYSPVAIENAPPIRPAIPARRTAPAVEWAPAMPRISETLDTSPSLMPNTAARAPPPLTLRCWCSAGTMTIVPTPSG